MDKLTISQIKRELKNRNLSQTGKKQIISDRLKEALEKEGKNIETEVELILSGNLEENENEDEELDVDDSASVCSRVSQGSSVLSKRISVAARRAAIEARIAKHKEEKQLDEDELELKKAELKLKEAELALKRKRKNLVLETELAETLAEESVLLQAEADNIDPMSAETIEENSKDDLNRLKFKGFIKKGDCEKQLSNKSELIENNSDSLIRALISCNLKGLMPQQCISKFDGNCSKYMTFIRAFDSIISEKLTSDKEKLHYLEQYTDKTPNDIVKACLHLESTEGYKKARLMLDNRYGRPEIISNAYIETILSFKNIGNDDIDSLDEFSLKLMTCRDAVSGIDFGLAELNNPKTIRDLVEKLPFSIQEKWRFYVDRIIVEEGRNIGFDELVNFVERHARALKNPLYGRHLFKNGKNTDKLGMGTDLNWRDKNKVKTKCNMAQTYLKCWFCQGEHVIGDCVELSKLDHQEKLSVLWELQLCYKCLKYGHYSKFCPNNIECQKCSGPHHSILHWEIRDNGAPQNNLGNRQSLGNSQGVRSRQLLSGSQASNNSRASGSNQTVSGNSSNPNVNSYAAEIRTIKIFKSENSSGSGMSVVPVKIKLNKRVVETYAFLDNGSSATFCTAGLIGRLHGKLNDSANLDVSTVHGSKSMKCGLLAGLQVSDYFEENILSLPTVYVIDEIPVAVSDRISSEELRKWKHLDGLVLPEIEGSVEILIGSNVPHALEPFEVIRAFKEYEPFAIRTRLGWMVCGGTDNSRVAVNKTSVAYNRHLDEQLIKEYNKDFGDVSTPECGFSEEDKKWLNIVKNGSVNIGNRYEVPLPLINEQMALPNSLPSAFNRLKGLRNKLLKDRVLHDQYLKFMTEMFTKNYAEYADFKAERCWYIPHFGVRHKDKPDKVRVVFDCAARVSGVALNDILLSGPDLLSPLLKVLLNFRVGLYAYSADIETMFYQVRVPEKHRDLLRFLWYKDNDLKSKPISCRMTVHLFGASSSPSVANFVVRKIAEDNLNCNKYNACETLQNCFYVDDCLKSDDSINSLINNAIEVRNLCIKGGFILNKYISPNIELLECFDKSLWSKNVEKFFNGENGSEKSLGLIWNGSNDTLSVAMKEVGKIPESKRQLLSKIASVYDPLGILSPTIIEGRVIMQDLCRSHVSWDAVFSEKINSLLRVWFSKLNKFLNVSIPRCMKPVKGENIRSLELHIFSDASESAYAAVAYLRVESDGEVFCSFVMGKAKVSPLKSVSVPRLELTAATLSIKLKYFILRSVSVHNVTFWTDSTTVLRYIENDKIRYQTFVANRVSLIRESSHKFQWKYIRSEENPADDATRGFQSLRWIRGPEFLLKDSLQWPTEPKGFRHSLENLEIKKEEKLLNVSLYHNVMFDLISYYSCWYKLRKAFCYYILYLNFLRNKYEKRNNKLIMNCDLLKKSEKRIVVLVQSQVFGDELNACINGLSIKKSSSIYKLNPVLIDDLICVGGRLQFSNLNPEERNPIILPYKGHVTDLIVYHYHNLLGHMGLSQVLAKLRSKYWIVKGNAAVRRVLSNCILCRKAKALHVKQMMADLPEERIVGDFPPFHTTGIDCFGPFFVKRGRSQIKRYGVMFTCFKIRAIHLEIVFDLTTDSFINALRRFCARRGQVKVIYSDHGTNLVGTKRMLDTYFENINITAVHDYLLGKGVDWHLTPPGGSNFGGTWERMIGVVRRVLDVTLNNQSVDDEGLHTLLCEAECIINSRPLTVVTSDSQDLQPITPNSLLNMGESSFEIRPDLNLSYTKRRWHQVQYMAQQFWLRWKSEYLLTLQKRQKWVTKQRDVKIGDIVLVIDENTPRCHWPLAIITEVVPSRDNLIRRVKVKCSNKIYERPLSKIVMILENEKNICNIERD